jgi:hypothetical protein
MDGRIGELGDSEIEQLDGAIGGYQDVSRLEVAMDHQAAVSVQNGSADALHESQAVGDGERLLLNVLGDGAAFDILHHQVGNAVDSSAVEEAGDIGVFEVGENLAFGSKAGDRIGSGQHAGNDLDGDLFAELIVFAEGAVDGAHSAAAEYAIDAVGAQPGAY